MAKYLQKKTEFTTLDEGKSYKRKKEVLGWGIPEITVHIQLSRELSPFPYSAELHLRLLFPGLTFSCTVITAVYV